MKCKKTCSGSSGSARNSRHVLLLAGCKKVQPSRLARHLSTSHLDSEEPKCYQDLLLRGYEVTPARTGVSLPIWKYQLCAVSPVTVRVYSKSFRFPQESPPGSVTFKLAHLLSEVRGTRSEYFVTAPWKVFTHICTLLEFFFFFSI